MNETSDVRSTVYCVFLPLLLKTLADVLQLPSELRVMWWARLQFAAWRLKLLLRRGDQGYPWLVQRNRGSTL